MDRMLDKIAALLAKAEATDNEHDEAAFVVERIRDATHIEQQHSVAREISGVAPLKREGGEP